MAEQQPFTVDDLCYTANDFRLMERGLVCVPGVSDFAHLLVFETIPASGDVWVFPGHAFIGNSNDTSANSEGLTIDGYIGSDKGGTYHVYNDDIVALTVPLNSTGSDRTDVVWAQVCDSEYAAVTSGFTLFYDDNNPTETAPADGCTYYRLAVLTIPNGAGSGGTNITGFPSYFGETDGMIQDNRSAFVMCGDDAGWVQDSATLDFPSVGAGLAETLTMTVRGATTGDPVAVGTTIGAFSSQLIWSAYVSATDTVTCRVFNPTGGALNPPSSTWRVAVKIR